MAAVLPMRCAIFCSLQSDPQTANKFGLPLLANATIPIISVLQQNERALAGFFPMFAQQAAADASRGTAVVGKQPKGGVYAGSDSST
jgi:hypothetical protein